MKVPLDIFSGFYQSESTPFNSQRCINLIPIIPEAQSLNNKALFGFPGISAFATITGKNRGTILANKKSYFVNGTALHRVNSDGTGTSLGTVGGVKRVSMATNTTVDGNTKIVIVVPGGSSYVYDESVGSVVSITDPDFITADSVVFKDGYFVFSASNGLNLFQSSLNDPLTFDALETGTAEIDPDLIVALTVNHNELFVMGEETAELFQNVGGNGFVFQRIPGANIQKGLHARAGMVNFDNSFAFVGGGKNEMSAIWKVSGSSSAVKISTTAIDTAIQKFTKEEIAESFAISWSMNGNYFLSFTFESLRIPSKTFVYNATTSAFSGGSSWFELQSGVSDNRWRVQSMVQAYGKLLVGDRETGKIGYLDNSVYTEYGDVILRYVVSSPFRALDNSQFWDSLELRMESGVGLATGQGSEPVIRMSYSNNGGRSFSSEFARGFGKIGEYLRRTIWRRQGRIPTERVLRFTMTDPVRCNILACTVNDEVGE